jgi:hypothetical protein
MSDTKVIQCHRSEFSSITEIGESAISQIDISEPLNFADGAEVPQSIATRFGIEWNDSGLLVYFRGRFEQLRYLPQDKQSAPNSKTPKLWEVSDVYEIFIGPDAKNTMRYKEFQVSPDARWVDIDVDRQLGISNHHWYSGMQCRSMIDHELRIWTSIAELPWNCFGPNKKTGEIWNANFYRASGKYHGDELLAWSATGYGEKCFHRPEHFGTINFVK